VVIIWIQLRNLLNEKTFTVDVYGPLLVYFDIIFQVHSEFTYVFVSHLNVFFYTVAIVEHSFESKCVHFVLRYSINFILYSVTKMALG